VLLFIYWLFTQFAEMSQNSDTPNSKIENATGVRDSKLKKALEKKADKPTKAEINLNSSCLSTWLPGFT